MTTTLARSTYTLLFLLLCAVAGNPSDAADARERSGRTTQDVLEHHGNAARSGGFVVPGLTWERAHDLHRDPGFHADIAGPVYAQPLYWRFPGSARASLLVATEQNRVYALDAETGATLWETSLGAPVPRSSLPCGDIDPLGITGTPVIDPRSQAMYLDAMVGGPSGSAPKHLIYALSLKNGSVLPGWPIDVAAALAASGKTFDAPVQNQRGALTIVANTVYVPYGGHYGDCGDYRGWVVAVSLSAPHAVHGWSTRARGGGIWAPGGVSADRRGIYAVTGNTIGARAWSGGEAVIHLGPDLSFSGNAADFFAPSDWQALDAVDADLGGTGPLLVDLPGGRPSALVLALGKDGKTYLLDRRNLGGIGAGIVVKKVASDAIRTAPAYFSSAGEALVAFAGRGVDCPGSTRGDLTALRIAARSPPRLSMAWCAEALSAGMQKSPLGDAAEKLDGLSSYTEFPAVLYRASETQ